MRHSLFLFCCSLRCTRRLGRSCCLQHCRFCLGIPVSQDPFWRSGLPENICRLEICPQLGAQTAVYSHHLFHSTVVGITWAAGLSCQMLLLSIFVFRDSFAMFFRPSSESVHFRIRPLDFAASLVVWLFLLLFRCIAECSSCLIG